MTPDVLDRRIRQMHASLAGLESTDSAQAVMQQSEVFNGFYTEIRFDGGRSEVDLYNMAEQLVANIARMKDHLKAWCAQHNVPFVGDHLINSSRSVAIIHDLWNTDKHAVLSSPPRSGHKPRLAELKGWMVLSTGGGHRRLPSPSIRGRVKWSQRRPAAAE